MRWTKRTIECAIRFAKREQGHKEIWGANDGPRIREYRAGDRTGKPVVTRGDWCAAFASWCLSTSTVSPLPFETSRGARRLVKNASKAPGATTYRRRRDGKFTLPQSCPGLISWKRWSNGKWHPWKGHVGFTVSYDHKTDTLMTVEGNVRGGVRCRTYTNGSWRKRLDRVVVWL